MKNLIYTAILLIFLTPAANADSTKDIEGQWITAHQIQKTLGNETEPKETVTYEIQLIETSKFWGFRQTKQVEEKIKKLAAQRGHKIIATGLFGGGFPERPLAWMSGMFMLTHKEGNTFLCAIDIDGGGFEPWKIQYIPGQTQEKDLFFMEIKDNVNHQKVTAFQRTTKP